MLADLLTDATFYFGEVTKGPKGVARALASPSVVAARLCKWSSGRNRLLRPAARRVLLLLFSCDVAPGVQFNGPLSLPHPLGIVIGAGTVVGRRVTIYQNVTLGRSTRGNYPVIGDDVTIFPGAVVFGTTRLPDKAVVGANAVVGRGSAQPN